MSLIQTESIRINDKRLCSEKARKRRTGARSSQQFFTTHLKSRLLVNNYAMCYFRGFPQTMLQVSACQVSRCFSQTELRSDQPRQARTRKGCLSQTELRSDQPRQARTRKGEERLTKYVLVSELVGLIDFGFTLPAVFVFGEKDLQGNVFLPPLSEHHLQKQTRRFNHHQHAEITSSSLTHGKRQLWSQLTLRMRHEFNGSRHCESYLWCGPTLAFIFDEIFRSFVSQLY